MTTTKRFEQIEGVTYCNLTLYNGVTIVIPIRKDGYMFVTDLCKSYNKKFCNYHRSKETIEILDLTSSSTGILSKELIDIYKGGNKKKCQGTWIHQDLFFHFAQWCSSDFSIQVSKWMQEIVITDKLEIGNEKTSDELKKEYEKKCNEMIKEYEKELEKKTNIIIKQNEEKLLLTQNYEKVNRNHREFLHRKEIYKLRKSCCIYLIIMQEGDMDKRIKIGFTKDITDRVTVYRTSNPFCKLLYVMYTEDCLLLETSIKKKYEKERFPKNSEFICNISLETLIKEIKNITELINIEYKIEEENELITFNRHNIEFSDVIEKEQSEEQLSEITKRCGGLTHMTEESRFLPLTRFFKNSGNEDGVNRICKDCHLVGVYGDKRKIRKIVQIPEYDNVTQKWCNRCEKVHPRDNFFKSKDTKDGLYANCKNCKNEQKKSGRLKSKNESKNETKNEIKTI